MPFRPPRWVLYAPVAVLPFLAALFLQGRGLHDDLSHRVLDAVTKAGGTWAKADLDGRDVKLAGDAPSQEQLNAVIAAAAGTHGVRRVDSILRVVEPPPAAPTVKPVTGEWGSFAIAGTWPEGKGNTLTLALGGKTYVLSKDAALASDGSGNWTLSPESPLPPGTYDVVATATSASGLSSTDSSRDEISVAAPPDLKAPTVDSLETSSHSPAIKGTWDPEVATSLAVTLGTTVYRLGADTALTASGPAWTLVPPDLDDGTYDITAEVGDKRGRTATSASIARLVVDSTAPAAPVVDPVTQLKPLKVTGTWAEGDAVSLAIRLGGETWTLGADKALAGDGKGRWAFTPDLDLKPGAYDVEVMTADRLGNMSRDSSANEINVPAPPPPPVMKPPTVAALLTNLAAPVIHGTWDSKVAKTLTVRVGPTAFKLGTAKELTADGDAWTLSLPHLEDGDYDVSAETGDGSGLVVSMARPSRLTVDTKPPAVPVIGPIAGALPLKASGTWPEGDAVKLVVTLAGKLWTLGKDAALSTDGKGNWSFAPDIELSPGTYDLGVEVTDRAGNVSRDATTNEITIAPPVVMEAPTVRAGEVTSGRPVVNGTWSEIAAKALSVSVGTSTFVLGTNPELTSDGIGNWTLVLPSPLADGTYDVSVTSTNAAGKSLSDTTKNELVVDAMGPATPTVSLYSGLTSPTAISGTWDSKTGSSLHVTVPSAKIDATLGNGVTMDGNKWTVPLAAPLAPGSYDVVAEAADAKGRTARDQTRFEILVKEPPPPAMKPPTVEAYSGEAVPSDVHGTWDEGVAKSLSVAIDGTAVAAVLGKDEALTSDGKGNWTLRLSGKIEPGIYDIVVKTMDAQGQVAADSSTAELYIKAPPPPPPPEMKPPTVAAYSGKASPDALHGTWDEAVAKTLSVAIDGAGVSAVLGKDEALSSDGKGNWTLKFAAAIPPGIYDVVVKTTDAAGKTASDSSTAELYIVQPPPPYDCGKAFAAVQPVHFRFNRWNLDAEHAPIIADAAAVLTDARCLDKTVTIEGHADYIGGRLYNEALSIQRSMTVLAALAAKGVEPRRMHVLGQGERSPEVTDHTDVARARNRRVTITLVQ